MFPSPEHEKKSALLWCLVFLDKSTLVITCELVSRKS